MQRAKDPSQVVDPLTIERTRYVRAAIASMQERAAAWNAEHRWNGIEAPGVYWARAFADIEAAFVPNLALGTPRSIADAFADLCRSKGVPAGDVEAVVRNTTTARAPASRTPSSRLAMHALALTGTSNQNLRKTGDARRWYALLPPGEYALSEAKFFLLEPSTKDALVKEGLYRTFLAGMSQQLYSLPLAILFWVATIRAYKQPTALWVGAAVALFVAWRAARWWLDRSRVR